ncbi:hypothetical protein SUGI_0559800 [Cryptomeria japonica]|nr:hypothetical protein SUGI_0559800 [Cryptomeria japonica]
MNQRGKNKKRKRPMEYTNNKMKDSNKLMRSAEQALTDLLTDTKCLQEEITKLELLNEEQREEVGRLDHEKVGLQISQSHHEDKLVDETDQAVESLKASIQSEHCLSQEVGDFNLGTVVLNQEEAFQDAMYIASQMKINDSMHKLLREYMEDEGEENQTMDIILTSLLSEAKKKEKIGNQTILSS